MKLDALTILAAEEPSKVPFYVAGALLASWAVVLSAIGLSRAEFPGTAGRARLVMGISALLVLTTAATAIATSSKHHPEEGEQAEQPGEKTGPPERPEKPGTQGNALEIAAASSGDLKFDKSSLTAEAGEVKVEFDNPSQVAHDFTVRDAQGELGGTKVITNSKASATIPLKKGSYTFYCSVDAHRQSGMEGKLTVS